MKINPNDPKQKELLEGIWIGITFCIFVVPLFTALTNSFLHPGIAVLIPYLILSIVLFQLKKSRVLLGVLLGTVIAAIVVPLLLLGICFGILWFGN
jgi:hypothetical protein